MKRHFFNFALFSFVLLLTNSCTNKKYELMQTQTEVKAEPVEEEAYVNFEYKIQPHDRLAITAYKYPEITPTEMNSRGILVDNRGNINLPLIHKVHVAGLTQPQVTRKLERRYSKYLRNPSFNVEVLNKRVYVLGEVNKPGVIPLDRERLTLLEAIAYAGDLKDDAQRDSIIILSPDRSGRLHMRKVDLTNFNAMQASNMLVKPNDIIYVKPNKWKKIKVNTENISTIIDAVSSAAAPYMLIKNLD